MELSKLARRGKVPPRTWQRICHAVMEEAQTVPGFDQVMERKAFIENYLVDLGRRYRSSYNAGWVNLVDARFLYWAVRTAKPKTIVQTGVSNGLSSAFMMLALAKNGPQGRLHAIDLPHIFNPMDPAWTRPDIVYGVAIPQGESSGWMVPDIYRDRFKVERGDAGELLPILVDRLQSIDMFYHDSDHTYAHMMFEFREVKRKLTPGGLIVADDISWNASLWDFADEHRVPSYNYKGSVGVAFF
jgi:predicted O-methyltransferase YrrM